MNLDLILENIRLKHIETLLQEATTDLEVVRGQRLINESIMQLRGVLMQEAEVAQPSDLRRNLMLGGGALGAAIGGHYGYDAADNAHKMAEDNNEDYLKSVNEQVDKFENDPENKDNLISHFGTDYMNGYVPYSDKLATPMATSIGIGAGGLVGGLAGSTLGGLGARRSIRR